MNVQTLTSIINQVLPEPHAGLLAGLMFGTKTSLSQELYDALVRSGTLHIVALSGMNISIVAGILGGMFTVVMSKRVASLVILLAIWWFVLFVGPSASIVRAAIMGSISLLAVVSGRQYWSIFSWVLATTAMLLLNFQWLFDISFQLSVLATLGIILFGKTEKNILLSDLRLTLSAQVFTIPIILYHFHRISLISPVSNILIGWLIGPLTMLGWGTVFFGSLWLPLGKIIAWIDWTLLSYLVAVVTWTAKVPFASLGF
ncbi:MAG: hypothetical protein ACD_36C00162G0001 [uncultured bacterium]|uniref:ComEC/Rec2-related protein domain-containing protein n=1 Tax=Candidatus Gottesmanbacteria bacterium RIFCSPLOWO2_01_FULL_43_11b TaxID=1798392 RepID=A0A1F6AHH7_9BACT|nr:MAG: hypothetical protein ACD_36C00162G0001 [uncultured bacterium]OGG23912.1 MAG: hypothetical protein A3A79_01790 [Candidatus Gottesmanbacteria bacterium RIFCSPLOWO2_01_FULL_43_11b]